MTTEYGVRYRRSDGTEYDSFATGWTEEGARRLVDNPYRSEFYPVPVAAISRSVGLPVERNEEQK